MILHCANDGNLREYLQKNFSKLQWIQKLYIARNTVHGLMYLHENNIAHRDLHSMNILIDNGQPMIADFGLSKQINEALMTSNSNVHGIPAYIDPQCFLDDKYKRDMKSDIYSFGVILWEISSGKPQFEFNRSRESLACKIASGVREIPREGTPLKYVELYKKCWDTHPSQRPKAESVSKTLKQFIVELSGGSCSTNRFNIPSIEINGEGSSNRKNKVLQNNNTFNSSTSSLFLSTNKNNGSTNEYELALSFNELKSTSQNIRAHSFDNKLIEINGKKDELEKIIRENKSPTLDIEKHKIVIGIKEAKLLADTLRRNPGLGSLNLSFTKLNNEGANILSEALCINTTLTFLDLSMNKLSSEGGVSLADALSKNKSLTSLNLFSNNLGSEGGKALAKALCVNTKLKTLNVRYNSLGHEGGGALANALTKNNTLEALNVGSNNIGPEGAKAFCEAINKNKTLKTLILENNNLGSEGGMELSKLLINRMTFITLNVKDNNFDPPTKQILNLKRSKYIEISFKALP
ncbi:hypothetical protein C2G38_855123 [Gigaspora rosea]|uniref:Protein kinase domain-containing protein n=1 Tax=Gigaspora rosea TaxID=44941 RepID=A0A397VNS6_9GLOM|nr:hypothetical protein C2G38_855123 [Gigaspora rosea]